MLGAVAGCAAQLQQAQLWPVWAYVLSLLCALALTSAASRCRGASMYGGWLLVGAAMAWGSTGWRAHSFQAQAMPSALEGVNLRVSGVIDGMPQRTERGLRFPFEVERAYVAQPRNATNAQLRAQDIPVALPPHIALSWYGPVPPEGLQAGQRWEWTVRLKAPHGNRNPYGMDWELWLWAQGIQATGYVRNSRSDRPPQWLAQTWQAPIAQWRGHVHSAMQAPPQASVPMQQAYGVLQALVTGAQSSIDQRHWQLFRDTGVAHLVSISGLHITMFAWLAVAIVNRLWRLSHRLCLWCPAPVAAAWCGLLLAGVYALFSGWGIPAQRTLAMLALVVWLRTRGGIWPWPYVWLLVLTGVVALDPWALLQPGFWLSFVAVGVLFAAQQKAVPIRDTRGYGLSLLKEQAVVGLALAPLTLLLFGQVSLVGLLANLWAIPWVTLVVTPLAMLGVLVPPLWTVAAGCVSGMVVALEWMLSWPLAVLYFAQPPVWAAALGVLACIWMVLPVPWSWRAVGLPLVLPMLWWQPALPPDGEFDVLALDVGQGSAVLVRTQHHALLFDAGPRWGEHSDAGQRTVLPLLRSWAVSLDVWMISHEDSDHAGGTQAVAAAYPRAKGMGAGGVPCQAGQGWQWDGVRFEVLHPMFAAEGEHQRAGNAQSCVLRVQARSGAAALMTGDIEQAQEQALLQAGVPIAADWVAVPHHGSRTSSSAAWVAGVSPQWAVVQAGYRNRFGHPDLAVMRRYESVGSQWVQSPDCGAAYWRSWQVQELVCERAERQRYWHYRATEPQREHSGE